MSSSSRFIVPFVVAATLGGAPAHGAPTTTAVRLADHAGGTPGYAVIDSTVKTTLPGTSEEETAIPLPAALPPQPVLMVAAGLTSAGRPVTFRFEIWLRQRDGGDEKLYGADHGEPGWWPIRIDLGGHELRGATLIFRRRILEGTKFSLGRGVWGDPVITSGGGAAPAPSVILISLDTLRADHVGLYGYRSARTPTLDGLGRTGVWYEQAYSPSAWTEPSHASLLYGGHLERSPPGKPPPGYDGPTAAQSLMGTLRDRGYQTAAFTGGGFMAATLGPWRGFDNYYFYPQPKSAERCPPERFDGKVVFNKAAEWLRDRGRSPFFLLVHTYDIHDRCPFIPPGSKGWENWDAKTDKAKLLAYYDKLIADTDALVGELMAELERLGLAQTTLVVITSDHGEYFDEHGLRGHGCLKLYEDLIHVPLIFHFPARLRTPKAIAEPVSLIDVAPSILALLEVPIPPQMQGTPLPGLGIDALRRPGPVYASCNQFAMVRQGNMKLLTSRDGSVAAELYDLAADPREIVNLAGDADRVAPLQALAAQGERLLPAFGGTPAPEREVDEATRERLRALGYE